MSLFYLHPFKDLRGGDVVRFWLYEHGLSRERKECTGAVHPMLVFDDHVIVKRGPCGTIVNDDNFIKLVRRARRQS